MEQGRGKTCYRSGNMREVDMKDRSKGGECLGSGGNAKVSFCGSFYEGKPCVIKEAKNDRMSLMQLRNEWEVLKNLTAAGYEYSPRAYSFSGNELVMDLIDGDTLDKAVDFEFDEQELKGIFLKICRAVEGLHGCDPPVIHRDLKPSNIMIDKNGKLFLIDFGIAKIMRGYGDEESVRPCEMDAGKCRGTRNFAAPEQYGGLLEECVGTDIYQLGKTMEYLCKKAGISACFTGNIFAGDMEGIIGRCCSAGASGRYLRVSEVRADLLKVRTGGIGRFLRKGKLPGRKTKRSGVKNRKSAEKPQLFIDIVRTFDTIEFL